MLAVGSMPAVDGWLVFCSRVPPRTHVARIIHVGRLRPRHGKGRAATRKALVIRPGGGGGGFGGGCGSGSGIAAKHTKAAAADVRPAGEAAAATAAVAAGAGSRKAFCTAAAAAATGGDGANPLCSVPAAPDGRRETSAADGAGPASHPGSRHGGGRHGEFQQAADREGVPWGALQIHGQPAAVKTARTCEGIGFTSWGRLAASVTVCFCCGEDQERVAM